ncbi:Oligosaccharide translocation protein rft1 [Halocaridina rubra]|uniref:Protein RFT1 homolog n=1 Tax=Halocaridina rubra TaxID=373956 RepID=A0AAN8WQV6_HALRR
MDHHAIKASALQSATYDTILQIGLRIMSFILNAFIVRHVSREAFAVMTVRLHLLYSTGLLLSREAFRRAVLSSKGNKQIHKVINLVWIGTLVSGPVSILGYYIWMYIMELPPQNVTKYYGAGVVLMILSVVTEVVAEVPFVLAELQLWSKTKVIIEGVMQLTRTALVALLVFFWPVHSVFVFGISHIVGSIVYSSSYYALFIHALRKKDENIKLPIRELKQLLPRRSHGRVLPEVDHELGALSWSFFKQGWLKEALTEGEHYIMNFFPLISLSQQGVYQVVNNLGSLAARLVFRSIETAAYKYFARMLYRGKSIQEQDQVCIAEVSKFFRSIFQNLILVSLVIIVFGWSYSRTLLQLYGGIQLSDSVGTALMRAQCFYIVFLAVNGITEAYTFAVMDDSQLSRHNWLLVLLSLVYICCAVFTTQFVGALGFIFANSVNMGLRIAYSFWFIYNQYRGSGFQPLTLQWFSTRLAVVYLAAFLTTCISEIYLYPRSMVLHIVLGGATLLVVTYTLRMEFRPVLQKIFGILNRLSIRLIGKDEDRLSRFHPLLFIIHLQKFMYDSEE